MITSGSSPDKLVGRGPGSAFAFATLGLVICFSVPLYGLARFALSSELYSYVLLIPLISAYLAWIGPRSYDVGGKTSRRAAIFLALAGVATFSVYWVLAGSGKLLAADDAFSLTTLSFVLLFFGICAWFLNSQTIRDKLFPIGILILLVPLPVFVRSWMESSLQHWSALAAVGMLDIAGTPVFNTGNTLQLSDINLQVAPECSGIHSSIALFITSLVAGHLFLRSKWKRTLLAVAVIPLGILRNGFRIFTIGELCTHIGPEMIDSKIHRKGGPVFFVLSLVPFLLLLYLLIKSERRSKVPQPVSP